MRNSIKQPLVVLSKHLNKDSRLYFHIALKTNRQPSLQEKRFSTPSYKADKIIVNQLIESLLKETGVVLEQTC